MLTCLTCSYQKPETDFYVSCKSKCKDCTKAAVKTNRVARVDYYRAFDKERNATPERVERRKRYAATEAGQASSLKARLKWRAVNPEKRAAHVILGNAVRDGKVGKPKHCTVCGKGGRIQGHHHDYTKPLDVEWLCGKCHYDEHH